MCSMCRITGYNLDSYQQNNRHMGETETQAIVLSFPNIHNTYEKWCATPECNSSDCRWYNQSIFMPGVTRSCPAGLAAWQESHSVLLYSYATSVKTKNTAVKGSQPQQGGKRWPDLLHSCWIWTHTKTSAGWRGSQTGNLDHQYHTA